MRTGRRLGVDVGRVRIGVAQSDPEGRIATPLETVQAGKRAASRLIELATAAEVLEIVVGLPTLLSGNEGEAAIHARGFAMKLHGLTQIPIRLVDERLSTVIATSAMHEAGVSSRKGRASIDQAAAVVILQSALEAERNSGRPPGELIA